MHIVPYNLNASNFYFLDFFSFSDILTQIFKRDKKYILNQSEKGKRLKIKMRKSTRYYYAEMLND